MNGCALGRISRLMVAAPALSISEKETGPAGWCVAVLGRCTFRMVGYRPSIEPCTFVTFVPPRIGRVVTLLVTPFSTMYSRLDAGAAGGNDVQRKTARKTPEPGLCIRTGHGTSPMNTWTRSATWFSGSADAPPWADDAGGGFVGPRPTP